MFIIVLGDGLLVVGFVGLFGMWTFWFLAILEQTQLIIVFGIIGSPEKGLIYLWQF